MRFNLDGSVGRSCGCVECAGELSDRMTSIALASLNEKLVAKTASVSNFYTSKSCNLFPGQIDLNDESSQYN